jgi:hypothetical protein
VRNVGLWSRCAAGVFVEVGETAPAAAIFGVGLLVVPPTAEIWPPLKAKNTPVALRVATLVKHFAHVVVVIISSTARAAIRLLETTHEPPRPPAPSGRGSEP